MADGANEQPVRPEDDFGLSAVRELLHLLSQSDITEIQIERPCQATSRCQLR
jgi:hypothetical protein